jgi:hypothetical protein
MIFSKTRAFAGLLSGQFGFWAMVKGVSFEPQTWDMAAYFKLGGGIPKMGGMVDLDDFVNAGRAGKMNFEDLWLLDWHDMAAERSVIVIGITLCLGFSDHVHYLHGYNKHGFVMNGKL